MTTIKLSKRTVATAVFNYLESKGKRPVRKKGIDVMNVASVTNPNKETTQVFVNID